MSLGNNIRTIRKSKGVTISQLSAATGVSRSTITDIESDNGRKPNTVTLEKFAKALNVSMDDFFKEDLESNLVEDKVEDLPKGYLRVARDAQKKGISPEDMDLALSFLMEMRKRDEAAKKAQNK
jgi:XRE family transcriptional regulator of biofilm formation